LDWEAEHYFPADIPGLLHTLWNLTEICKMWRITLLQDGG
jgi:hypothetical protein